MMVWSINLLILSIGIFIVGMFRPNFILFWMEKPRRIAIAFLSVLILMIGLTMYGEALREHQKIMEQQAQLMSTTNDDIAPTIEVEAGIKKQ